MNIERLNERIMGLVERFNNDRETNGDIYASVEQSGENLSVEYLNREQMRDRWVTEHYMTYMDDSSAIPIVDYDPTEVAEHLFLGPAKSVVVIQTNRGLGCSVCGRTDEYRHDIGVAIAYARAQGEKIPEYV